jgi:hypothetical protein
VRDALTAGDIVGEGNKGDIVGPTPPARGALLGVKLDIDPLLS